jgi:hypothetical protein
LIFTDGAVHDCAAELEAEPIFIRTVSDDEYPKSDFPAAKAVVSSAEVIEICDNAAA